MASALTGLRRVGLRVFRHLPVWVRRQLVRAATPNYTLGALVLLRDRDGRMLLLRQPPGSAWSLPGGLLNRGETPRDAAARELAEETGVRVDPSAVLPMSPNAQVNSDAQQVDLVFTATVDDPEIAVDRVEVAEARWFSPDALPPLTPPTARLLGCYDLGSGPGAEPAAGAASAPGTGR